MTRTEALSVRLDPETRRILSEAARTHDAAGASALARHILERWAAEQRDAKIRATAKLAGEYLRKHPAGLGRRSRRFLPKHCRGLMVAGQIVAVNWRDALPGSGEVNKKRPGIIVSSERFFGSGLPFEIVVPLTGESELAIEGASTLIGPTAQNGCTKPSFALAWNVQSVPHARIEETPSHITDVQLRSIREQISGDVAGETRAADQ